MIAHNYIKKCFITTLAHTDSALMIARDNINMVEEIRLWRINITTLAFSSSLIQGCFMLLYIHK